MDTVIIREAVLSDAENIGSLHAQSWRSAYRGLLQDSFLDNNLVAERKKYWTENLSALSSKDFVLVAESAEGVIGFAAVMDKPEKGYDALLNNLHVRPDIKGQGIGGKLLKAVAANLLKTGRKNFYLWVLKGNTPAEEFYKAKGGRPADHSTAVFGQEVVDQTRFVWDRLDKLVDGM
jgi:GNAT superfamily N-acetyltransferase